MPEALDKLDHDLIALLHLDTGAFEPLYLGDSLPTEYRRALPAPGEGDMLSPIFLGLQCADADDELSARIGRASQGYYTTKHEGALLVLPREGLIVFGYFG